MELKPEFPKLLEQLKTYEKNRFETRAFVYLDIISWLESKIRDVPVQKIIREKFLERNKLKEDGNWSSGNTNIMFSKYGFPIYLLLLSLFTFFLSRHPGHNGDMPFYIACAFKWSRGLWTEL